MTIGVYLVRTATDTEFIFLVGLYPTVYKTNPNSYVGVVRLKLTNNLFLVTLASSDASSQTHFSLHNISFELHVIL